MGRGKSGFGVRVWQWTMTYVVNPPSFFFFLMGFHLRANCCVFPGDVVIAARPNFWAIQGLGDFDMSLTDRIVGSR